MAPWLIGMSDIAPALSRTGASLTSRSVMVTEVATPSIGEPSSLAWIVSVNVGRVSKSRAAALATVISPVKGIANAPPTFPLVMAYVNCWPLSGSLAETRPTIVPEATFSSTPNGPLSSNFASSLMSFRLMVTTAVEDSTGEPLSTTWTVRTKARVVS